MTEPSRRKEGKKPEVTWPGETISTSRPEASRSQGGFVETRQQTRLLRCSWLHRPNRWRPGWPGRLPRTEEAITREEEQGEVNTITNLAHSQMLGNREEEAELGEEVVAEGARPDFLGEE